MDDSAAIAAGAPVRLNGITVGKVDKSDFRIERAAIASCASRWRWTNTFLPSIPGRLAGRHRRRESAGHQVHQHQEGPQRQRPSSPGAEIKSLDTREFDDVVQQGYSTLASLNGIFKKLDGILDQLQAARAPSASCFRTMSCTRRWLALLTKSTRHRRRWIRRKARSAN